MLKSSPPRAGRRGGYRVPDLMRTIALSNAFAEVSRFGAANSTAIAPEQRAQRRAAAASAQ